MTGPDADPATLAAEPQRPLLRVVKGDPTDEELAALVAVVSAVAAAAQVTAETKPRPQWSAPGRGHRTPLAAGRAGWRASTLPR